jgi:hypothetical protein
MNSFLQNSSGFPENEYYNQSAQVRNVDTEKQSMISSMRKNLKNSSRLNLRIMLGDLGQRDN